VAHPGRAGHKLSSKSRRWLVTAIKVRGGGAGDRRRRPSTSSPRLLARHPRARPHAARTRPVLCCRCSPGAHGKPLRLYCVLAGGSNRNLQRSSVSTSGATMLRRPRPATATSSGILATFGHRDGALRGGVRGAVGHGFLHPAEDHPHATTPTSPTAFSPVTACSGASGIISIGSLAAYHVVPGAFAVGSGCCSPWHADGLLQPAAGAKTGSHAPCAYHRAGCVAWFAHRLGVSDGQLEEMGPNVGTLFRLIAGLRRRHHAANAARPTCRRGFRAPMLPSCRSPRVSRVSG